MDLFTGLIELLKTLSPKKKAQEKYLDIIKLSIDMTTGEMDDILAYMKKHDLKITPSFVMRKQEELFHFHIKNQLSLQS